MGQVFLEHFGLPMLVYVVKVPYPFKLLSPTLHKLSN